MGKLYYFTIILGLSLALFTEDNNTSAEITERFNLNLFEITQKQKNDILDYKTVLVTNFRNRTADFNFFDPDILLFYRLQSIKNNQELDFLTQKLIQDLEKIKIHKVIFYDFSLSSKLILFLNQNNIDYETYGFNVSDNNYLVPDFDQVYKLLGLMNYDFSEKIYYLINPNSYVPSVSDFKTELEDFAEKNNKTLITVPIFYDRELINFLNKTNKEAIEEKKQSIIFVNLDYLYNEQNNILYSCCYCYITKIFETYSLKNIPIFFFYSKRCPSKFLIYQVNFEKQDFEIIINLDHFFKSRFAKNIPKNKISFFLTNVNIKE